MPRELTPDGGGHDAGAITLDELVEALDTDPFDPRDEDALASRAPLLAQLARNRGFLAELAIAELEQRCAGQNDGNSYGPQVLLLRPPNGRYVLRANFWPARDDAVVRASGTAPFFYDLPHDHNFSFLTVGYLGPGYGSDYYEYDGDRVVGLPGEQAEHLAHVVALELTGARTTGVGVGGVCGGGGVHRGRQRLAGLRFVERSCLSEGRVLLYRAHRDVHAQLPPDSFSVSLNIMAFDPAQPWRSQYRFDLERGTIAEALTVTPAEVLATLAVQLGGGDGIELARQLAASHPVPRMRAAAVTALLSLRPDDPEMLWRAAADPAPLVHAPARRRLAA